MHNKLIEKYCRKIKIYKMKKLILFLFLNFLLLNKSLACELLNVPIGTPISKAEQTFSFLTSYDPASIEEKSSIKYLDHAADYCENDGFDNTEIEVIVYDSKIAAINFISSDAKKNEIYNFTKAKISDPGIEAQKNNWQGVVDLSIGSLFITYGKYLKRGKIYESLEITNDQMINYVYGEQVTQAIW